MITKVISSQNYVLGAFTITAPYTHTQHDNNGSLSGAQTTTDRSSNDQSCLQCRHIQVGTTNRFCLASALRYKSIRLCVIFTTCRPGFCWEYFWRFWWQGLLLLISGGVCIEWFVWQVGLIAAPCHHGRLLF